MEASPWSCSGLVDLDVERWAILGRHRRPLDRGGPQAREDNVPDQRGVVARNLSMSLGDQGHRSKLLVRDRDAKFVEAFDEVFAADEVRVIKTPVRSPNANAYPLQATVLQT